MSIVLKILVLILSQIFAALGLIIVATLWRIPTLRYLIPGKPRCCHYSNFIVKFQHNQELLKDSEFYQFIHSITVYGVRFSSLHLILYRVFATQLIIYFAML
jgi:hypothetical protein